MSQLGQRLSNGTKGTSHCAAADRSLAGSKGAHIVAISEELERQDGVWHQGRINVEGGTKVFPDGPCGAGSIGPGPANPQGDILHDKAEVMLDVSTFGRWASCEEG